MGMTGCLQIAMQRAESGSCITRQRQVELPATKGAVSASVPSGPCFKFANHTGLGNNARAAGHVNEGCPSGQVKG